MLCGFSDIDAVVLHVEDDSMLSGECSFSFRFYFAVVGIAVVGAIDASPVVASRTALHLTADTLASSFDVFTPSLAALGTTALVVGVSARSTVRDLSFPSRHGRDCTTSSGNGCTVFSGDNLKFFFGVHERNLIYLSNFL